MKIRRQCNVFYQVMLDMWRENPTWDTVHGIYKDMITDCKWDVDEQVDMYLAWNLFFNRIVLKELH